MPRLLLVRHATSVALQPGHTDRYERPLSEAGVEQAARLVEVLVPYEPQRILSSPYLRAVQTVLPTAARLALPVERRHELREWESGIGAVPSWEEQYRLSWRDPTHRAAGGETQAELESRAVAALRSAAEESADGTVVLSSHGTWIARALHGLGHDVDEDVWLDLPMPAVVEVVLDAELLLAGVWFRGTVPGTATG